jgi:type II secretory pathway pseudopilin PulG
VTARRPADAGFTLVEALVATAVMVVVTGAVFAVLNPSQGAFQRQPEVVEMQQRLRVGVNTLAGDLMMAGAGAYVGSQTGTLAGFFAPIQPLRRGAMADYDDGPGGFWPDRLTLLYVPATSSQTTIVPPISSAPAELRVNAEPGCPRNQDLCGFREGAQVLIYDATGAYDTMTVTQIQAQAGRLEPAQGNPLSKAYGPDAKVVQVEQHVYFHDATTARLMHYDGARAASPVLDNVAGVHFEYYGEPEAPRLREPGRDRTMTYGPSPPPPGAVEGPWPAGENCIMQMAGAQPTARLADLGAPGSGPVRLTAAMLTDGPWCPDATNGNRFDADLLRIRRVRVSLWLRTGVATLRSPIAPGSDPLFGDARTGVAAGMVGDLIIRFDVSPRNVNLHR